MQTVPYRSAKIRARLERPAPWWKRMLARVRAWWRVQRENVHRSLPAILEHYEKMAVDMARMRNDMEKIRADRERFMKAAMRSRRARLDARLHTKPPPLPVPGPGREGIG